MDERLPPARQGWRAGLRVALPGLLLAAGLAAAPVWAQAPAAASAAAAVPGVAVAAGAASGVLAPDAAADPVLEKRMMAIAAELRCLVCQNQTIADSHAGLAVDLRQQVREMLAKGMDERQITDYMTDRYGDFVLYRPPFKTSTALLWAGPAVLLVVALGALFLVLRRRQRLGAEAFDPDVPDDDDDGAPRAGSGR